jgi:hypothetical protein
MHVSIMPTTLDVRLRPASPPAPNTTVDIADEELSALALAADPDQPLDADAVPLADALGSDAQGPLPAWYMPAPMGGAPPLRGWRRRVVLLVILAFLVITAFGLCNTYGQLHGG